MKGMHDMEYLPLSRYTNIFLLKVNDFILNCFMKTLVNYPIRYIYLLFQHIIHFPHEF